MNVVEEDTGPLPENPVQRKIWQVMELPHSSLPAQIVAVWSVFVILLSIVIFCIETLPRFRESRNDKNSALYGLEIFCVAWFTFEYVARLLAAPQKLRFVRSFLNIIDLIAILPYYIILGLSAGGTESSNTSYVAFFRILRLVRVFESSNCPDTTEG
ncbi:Potassium voltage-gated channel sub A member 2 [Desmophyllum pertusum]|uniref:Potassium voltage-gated channel sub A member 2 n=1 Tax=Desmophyllum pertusum TaxID=174260 RepID=A0A9X0CVB4_9CNID|nr:Potassium voltage-gated channel sub A member 2 [Desmophyllum pertusum]